MNLTNYIFSSAIGSIITNYLDLKQALGRQYETEYRIFKHLDEFLKTNESDLTAESFRLWCRTYEHKRSGTRRNWMRNVRNLCLYRQRTEPTCFIPDLLQFPPLHQPIQPYIFSEDEIARLFEAITELKPHHHSPMRCENFRLALILLYTAGLRRRELSKLKVGDYDSKEHTILIRESKFHKSRLIPLSQDGWGALENHLKIRHNHGWPISDGDPLLWHNKYGKNGKEFYTGQHLGGTFRNLFRIANIYKKNGGLPRLHDLRHTFAVHALKRWYCEDVNVQTKLPMLSIYMGHVSVVSTQYYLSFIEEVVNLANERFEKCYGTFIN